MITFEDCLHCSGLSAEEAQALARAERLPAIIAVAKLATVRGRATSARTEVRVAVGSATADAPLRRQG